MIPFKCLTHYSILKAFAKPKDLAEFALKNKCPAIALTDVNTISGIPEFFDEINRINKKNGTKIVPIAGSLISVKFGDRIGNINTIARNKAGWHVLIKILATLKVDDNENQYVDWADYRSLINDNVIVILGGLDCITTNGQENPEIINTLTDNVYEVYAGVEDTGLDADITLNEKIRFGWSKSLVLSCRPILYTKPEDAICQKVMVLSYHKKTINEVNDIKDLDYITRLTFNEISVNPIDNSSDILLNDIDQYSLSGPPRIPSCIKHGRRIENPDKELLTLAREGWKSRGMNDVIKGNKELEAIYTARVKEELSLFTEFKFSNYMLLVQSFADFAHTNGVSCTVRGSAGGALSAYLIGLSSVDAVWPDKTIPYDPNKSLQFSRFLNRGRMAEGNISLPDCDLDIGISFREPMKDYIRKTYGDNQVASIITFQRMDARATIKEVFRVLGVEFGFEIADEINKHIVDKVKVQDDLEDMREQDPTYNIIRYNIDHSPKVKEFSEEYKDAFDVIVRMVDTIKSHGKHAAGVVIGDEPLENLFPISFDKDGDQVIALEMEWAEYVGAVKFDLLGVAALEKIDKIIDMINNNLSEPR